MLTKEQEPTEPWGEFVESWSPVCRRMHIVGWVGALLFMCVSEVLAIHGLWFSPKLSFSKEKLFIVPLLVFLPCFLGFAMRIGIGKMSKVGQISLAAALNLQLTLSLLLTITYLVILELAGIAFG